MSHAHPGYRFSNQVPPNPLFFSKMRRSIFFNLPVWTSCANDNALAPAPAMITDKRRGDRKGIFDSSYAAGYFRYASVASMGFGLSDARPFAAPFVFTKVSTVIIIGFFSSSFD